MPRDYFSSVLQEAVTDDDRTVELQPAGRTGFDVVIDGVSMIEDNGAGMPWESFEIEVGKMGLDAEAQELVDDLLAARRRRLNRDRMERLNTESHSASEGERLPTDAE